MSQNVDIRAISYQLAVLRFMVVSCGPFHTLHWEDLTISTRAVGFVFLLQSLKHSFAVLPSTVSHVQTGHEGNHYDA